MGWWTAAGNAGGLIGDEPLDLLDQAFADVVAAYVEDHERPPTAAEWCELLRAVLDRAGTAWHDALPPGAAFAVGVVPAQRSRVEQTMPGRMPKPGSFFRVPLGRGLPAYGQVVAVADDHVVVRTLHTTVAEPVDEALLAAEDLIPPQTVTPSGFRDGRWQVLDGPAAAAPAVAPAPGKPQSPVPYELKIARRRTAIGMGPDADA